MNFLTRPILTHCFATFNYRISSIKTMIIFNLTKIQTNRKHTSFQSLKLQFTHSVLVLRASHELISIETMIKRRTKYFHLRQVSNQTFLRLDPTKPDPQDGTFWDPTRPNPTRPVNGPDPSPTLHQLSAAAPSVVFPSLLLV